MADSSGPIAIMFADMTGSTRLYDDLGNTAAIDVVSICLETLMKVVKQFRGTVIKTIGDEVMCSFPEAVLAALAASEMHFAMERLGEGKGALVSGIQVKVGVHFGDVLEEGGDIFGDAVNVAARMAGLAKADQILVTKDLVDALPPELHSTLRYYDLMDLKGKTERVEVFEIIWAVSDMTVAASAAPSVARIEHHVMVVTIGDQHVEMGVDKLMAISMGRAEDNDILCAGALTSRKHARIEYKRGRFTVTDQSANGTHVKADGEGTVGLRREYSQLEGAGYIGLGEDPDTMGDLAIHYSID
jgi:adenylate cyclase